jgi:hypothetical protein
MSARSIGSVTAPTPSGDRETPAHREWRLGSGRRRRGVTGRRELLAEILDIRERFARGREEPVEPFMVRRSSDARERGRATTR